MAGGQGALSKHLTYRKNWKLSLCCLFVLYFLVPLNLSFADNLKNPEASLQELGEVTASDWLNYSPDATKIAIVQTKQFPGSISYGESLQVYSVDSKLQPQQLLFEDSNKSQFITEFQWVEGHIVYLTVNSDNATELPMMKWLRSLFAQEGWKGVTDQTKVKVWPNDLPKNSDLDSVKFIPPGKIFSPKGNDEVLFFDVYQEKTQNMKTTSKMSYTERSISSFKIPSGKLQKSLAVDIRLPASRWPFSAKGLVPLFLSPDSGKLIAIVFLNRAWNNTYQSGPPALAP